MTALASWPARGRPFFEALKIPKIAATAPGDGGRAWFGACKTAQEQGLSVRVGARRVGQKAGRRHTMGAIRTFVLEVMEMGDRPELQDPSELSQPGKLLTAEEILSTPDEAPAADPRPARPKRVLDLDALIAEQEAEKGERRGITVARLLAASEGADSVIPDLPTVSYLQQALMPDVSGMVATMTSAARLVESFTPTANFAYALEQRLKDEQSLLDAARDRLNQDIQHMLYAPATVTALELGQRWESDLQQMLRAPTLFDSTLWESDLQQMLRAPTLFDSTLAHVAQSLSELTQAVTDGQAFAAQSIRNVLIPLDTLHLSLHALPSTIVNGATSRHFEAFRFGFERSARRALIRALGHDPNDPRWENVTMEQLRHWVETYEEIRESTGLIVVLLQPIQRNRAGRKPLAAYDLGRALVDSGMSYPDAFAQLVADRVITPGGRSDFERRTDYEDMYNKFIEAIKKRKQRGTIS